MGSTQTRGQLQQQLIRNLRRSPKDLPPQALPRILKLMPNGRRIFPRPPKRRILRPLRKAVPYLDPVPVSRRRARGRILIKSIGRKKFQERSERSEVKIKYTSSYIY